MDCWEAVLMLIVRKESFLPNFDLLLILNKDMQNFLVHPSLKLNICLFGHSWYHYVSETDKATYGTTLAYMHTPEGINLLRKQSGKKSLKYAIRSHIVKQFQNYWSYVLEKLFCSVIIHVYLIIIMYHIYWAGKRTLWLVLSVTN